VTAPVTAPVTGRFIQVRSITPNEQRLGRAAVAPPRFSASFFPANCGVGRAEVGGRERGSGVLEGAPDAS